MSKTIRRGGPPARRPVQPDRRVPAVRKQSIIDRALLMLPVSEATLQRIVTWTILSMIAAGGIGLSTLFGVPQAAGVAMAEAIGAAGFRVERIEVTGARRLNPMAVYASVTDQKSRAMPLVSLNEVRARLKRNGWVADAQVSRRLPDKLVIHIVERKPAAVWQHDGELALIDADGVPLERVSADRLPPLPLLVGDGANKQMRAFDALMARAPALRPLVKAASWIGDRRWNLLFATGETLVLPEDNAQAALLKFVELDSNRRLLGQGLLRFDMRDPTRFVVRRPEAGGARAITDTSASSIINRASRSEA